MTYNILLIIIALILAVPFVYYMIKDNNTEYNELKNKREQNKNHAHT